MDLELLFNQNTTIDNLHRQCCNNVPEIQAQLYQAIIAGNLDEITQLVNRGVDLNYRYHAYMYVRYIRPTPLEIAFKFTRFNRTTVNQIVNHLLELGADPNIYDVESLLRIYCLGLDLDNIVNLVNHGMNLDDVDDKGDTVLHMVIDKIPLLGNEDPFGDSIDLFFQNLVLPTNSMSSGTDPKRYQVIQYLISSGANITLSNHIGVTPLQLLKERNLEYLLDPMIKEPEFKYL